jgi:hypothetical protein
LYVGGDRIQGRSPERKVIANLYGAVEGSYVEEHRAYIPQQIEFLRRAGFLLDRSELSLCPPERLKQGDPKRALLEQIIALHHRYAHESEGIKDLAALTVSPSAKEPAPREAVPPTPLRPSREFSKISERLASAARGLYRFSAVFRGFHDLFPRCFAELAEWECVVKDPSYSPKLPQVVKWVDGLQTTKPSQLPTVERTAKTWETGKGQKSFYPANQSKSVLSLAGSAIASTGPQAVVSSSPQKFLDPRNVQRYDRNEMAKYRNDYVVYLARCDALVEQIRQSLGRAVEIGVLQREFVDSFAQRLPVNSSLQEVLQTRGKSSAKALAAAYDQFRSDYAEVGVLAQELCRVLGVEVSGQSDHIDSVPVPGK